MVFLNPEGHQNPISGSKGTIILLKGLILPNGGVALGRVCACSLRSRLVFIMFPKHRCNFLFSHKKRQERLFLYCLRFLFPNSDFTIFAVSERSLNKANIGSKENCCIGLQTFCYCRHIFNFCAIKDHCLNTIFCQHCLRFA